MEKGLFERFAGVLNQLSPENLCCDGELPPALVRARRKELVAEWAELEKEAGRKVSQEEIENAWYRSVLG